MKVLVVSGKEVRKWLPVEQCIPVMAGVLKMLAAGDALNPLRQVVWLPDKSGVLAMMPACLAAGEVMGVKAISVFPGNPAAGLDSHQGAVLIFETGQGRPLAIVDAGAVTAVRTAAVSALATRLLARKDAADLAILGSGVQASVHLEGMLKVRNITRVRVWSRNAEHVREFARREAERHGVDILAVSDARQAVEGALIICTTTASTQPVLRGAWLAPGAHINAVGACMPNARELDTDAVVRSRMFVDRRESTLNEAGDFLIPKKEGAVNDDHICGEIGEILIGRVAGRQSDDEITLFESLGIAVEDVAAAHSIYRSMQAAGAGTWVDLG